MESACPSAGKKCNRNKLGFSSPETGLLRRCTAALLEAAPNQEGRRTGGAVHVPALQQSLSCVTKQGQCSSLSVAGAGLDQLIPLNPAAGVPHCTRPLPVPPFRHQVGRTSKGAAAQQLGLAPRDAAVRLPRCCADVAPGSRKPLAYNPELSKLFTASAGSRMAVTRGRAAAGTLRACSPAAAAEVNGIMPAAAAAAAAAARGLPGRCMAWQGSSTLRGRNSRRGCTVWQREGLQGQGSGLSRRCSGLQGRLCHGGGQSALPTCSVHAWLASAPPRTAEAPAALT